MLSEKTSEAESAPARLFSNLLDTKKIEGLENPSPMDPINPRTIKKQSRLSACMKMDRIDPILLFLMPPAIFGLQERWPLFPDHEE